MTVPTVTLNNGMKMPILGLGTWASDKGEMEKTIRTSIKNGYTHIDCAAVYQNEAEIGEAIQSAIKEGSVTREDLWITSKLWNTKHAKENVLPALKKTLSDLQLEYLDLYLIHWPMSYPDGDDFFPKGPEGEPCIDESVDIRDTWKMMEQAVEQGLVKSIGLSNFNSKQIQHIIDNAAIKPAVLQVESHPYLPQLKLKAFCDSHQIAMTAYTPLGNPASALNQLPETPRLLNEPALIPIAEKYNKTPAQVLIRYQTQRGVIVIPKSANPERIVENISVFDFEMTPEEIETLNTLNKPFRYIPILRDINTKDYPFKEEF